MFDLLKFLLTSITMNTAWLATPADGDCPANADDEMRETRSGFQVRLNKEHKAESTDAVDGWHREGSAKGYYEAAEPTMRPDGTTSLNSDDAGRFWIDSDDDTLYHYSGSAWVGCNANGVSDQGGGSDLLCTVVEIGDWDMETTGIKDVAHGLAGDWGNIRSISGTIRADDDNHRYPIGSANSNGVVEVFFESNFAFGSAIDGITSTTISLRRLAGGTFEDSDFSTMGDDGNRGWITIWYVAS